MTRNILTSFVFSCIVLPSARSADAISYLSHQEWTNSTWKHLRGPIAGPRLDALNSNETAYTMETDRRILTQMETDRRILSQMGCKEVCRRAKKRSLCSKQCRSLQRTPVTEEHKLLPPGVKKGDNFGTSVAAFGDHYIMIGANQEGTNGKGAAYVFRRRKGKWIKEARFLGGLYSGYGLGKSVAISGKHAAAATRDSTGNVFLYYNKGNQWVQEAVIHGKCDYEYLGNSLSVSGAYVALGGWPEMSLDPEECDADHMVEVHHRQKSGEWVREARLKVPSYPSDVQWDLRRHVAISKRGYLVVSVYAYFRNAEGGWKRKQTLSSKGKGNDDDSEFGSSVSIDGEYLAVGSHSAVHIYHLDLKTRKWKKQARIGLSDCPSYNGCGPVSISGRYLVVGNAGLDNGLHGRVFQRKGKKWAEHTWLAPSDKKYLGDYPDWTANTVAMLGNGVVVGVGTNNEKGEDAGAAYVYEL